MRSDEANGAEVRPLRPEDLGAHRALMNQAFSGGAVVPPDTTFGEGAEKNVYGVSVGEELVAALTIRPFRAHWGENTLALGGIAGVATRPEARGKGYVGALLRHSLEVMKDAGQGVSALYPFSWAFYRRYGWEFVGEKRLVSLPLSSLRSAPEGRNVQALPTGDADALRRELEPVYTAQARRYNGVFTADTHHWSKTLHHNNSKTTYAYLYREPGQATADGYLLWRYGEGGEIRQFVANTPAAWRGLLSLLHYFGTQADKAKLTLPSDTPLWSHLTDWDLQIKIIPVFMGRVVHVAGALAALPAPPGTPNGSLTLQIADEYAPWNNGLFRVTVESGKVEAAPTAPSAAQVDVSFDIQAFSQAFWGQPSLSALQAAGRVSVASEDGFAHLAALLPSTPVFTLDDF